MGHGSYSLEGRIQRSKALGYDTKSRHEIFSQKSINNAMDPYNIRVRESRDSIEHPESVAIVLGLDVTGSMGSIPHFLVKKGLPTIVDRIIKGGIPDPQVLFLGLGDHECDNAPLQVGQFESSDELVDKWLTSVYLEGGGGGNDGESYHLAWYFAAYHASIDCFEKRNKKGYLFTIGDEPVLKTLPSRTLESLLGKGQYADYSADSLFEKASEKFNVYHIHVKETRAGSMQQTIDGWKQMLWDHLLIAERHEDIVDIISDTIVKGEKYGLPKSELLSNDQEEILL
jgi:hypothetical protein